MCLEESTKLTSVLCIRSPNNWPWEFRFAMTKSLQERVGRQCSSDGPRFTGRPDLLPFPSNNTKVNDECGIIVDIHRIWRTIIALVICAGTVKWPYFETPTFPGKGFMRSHANANGQHLMQTQARVPIMTRLRVVEHYQWRQGDGCMHADQVQTKGQASQGLRTPWLHY